jgi:N-acetylmuramoyl-L-alanine amidase
MRKLFLSAGHSLNESGAVTNNFKEANLTIELRDLIAAEIKKINSLAYIKLDSDTMSLKGYISELNKQVVSNDIIVDLMQQVLKLLYLFVLPLKSMY